MEKCLLECSAFLDRVVCLSVEPWEFRLCPRCRTPTRVQTFLPTCGWSSSSPMTSFDVQTVSDEVQFPCFPSVCMCLGVMAQKLLGNLGLFLRGRSTSPAMWGFNPPCADRRVRCGAGPSVAPGPAQHPGFHSRPVCQLEPGLFNWRYMMGYHRRDLKETWCQPGQDPILRLDRGTCASGSRRQSSVLRCWTKGLSSLLAVPCQVTPHPQPGSFFCQSQ